MDRRQQKTRKVIFQAFQHLLETKRFEAITVQQIIDEEDVGRSTFYAHFETKDELLRAMCRDIFDHVFGENLSSEKTHDFSGDTVSLQARLTHLLYHLRDNSKNISGILSCESRDLFLGYFKEYLMHIFSQYEKQVHRNAPESFVLNFLTGSFSETVLWWFNGHMEYTPEKVVECFISMVNFNFLLSATLPLQEHDR